VESLGYELWGIELSNQGKSIKFRLYIEKDNGVDVEDCALVSNHVSDMLDLEGFVSESYTLEVSSPGLDRVLFDETQYKTYVGHVVEVRLLRLFDGQRNFVGILKGVEEDCLVLQINEQEYLFPNEEIRKIRLVPVFD
jgi:ribosome maturation factor RimP